MMVSAFFQPFENIASLNINLKPETQILSSSMDESRMFYVHFYSSNVLAIS